MYWWNIKDPPMITIITTKAVKQAIITRFLHAFNHPFAKISARYVLVDTDIALTNAKYITYTFTNIVWTLKLVETGFTEMIILQIS